MLHPMVRSSVQNFRTIHHRIPRWRSAPWKLNSTPTLPRCCFLLRSGLQMQREVRWRLPFRGRWAGRLEVPCGSTWRGCSFYQFTNRKNGDEFTAEQWMNYDEFTNTYEHLRTEEEHVDSTWLNDQRFWWSSQQEMPFGTVNISQFTKQTIICAERWCPRNFHPGRMIVLDSIYPLVMKKNRKSFRKSCGFSFPEGVRFSIASTLYVRMGKTSKRGQRGRYAAKVKDSWRFNKLSKIVCDTWSWWLRRKKIWPSLVDPQLCLLISLWSWASTYFGHCRTEVVWRWRAEKIWAGTRLC